MSLVQQFTANWDDGQIFAQDPIDLCSIGGRRLPGLCTVTCLERIKIDGKESQGGNGSNPTDHGNELSEITITVRIWTQPQYDELVRVKNVIFPKTGRRYPLVISHPNTDFSKISRVFLSEWPAPTRDAEGFQTCEIKGKEYNATKKQTKNNVNKPPRPRSGSTNLNNATNPDPNSNGFQSVQPTNRSSPPSANLSSYGP